MNQTTIETEGPVWIGYDPASWPDRGAVISGLLTRDGFMTLYCGTWDPHKDAPLHALADEYHERCEAYDRTVCTGPILDGSIMPIDHRERYLISRNAQRVRRELVERGARLGFPRADVDRAIRKAAKRKGGRYA